MLKPISLYRFGAAFALLWGLSWAGQALAQDYAGPPLECGRICLQDAHIAFNACVAGGGAEKACKETARIGFRACIELCTPSCPDCKQEAMDAFEACRAEAQVAREACRGSGRTRQECAAEYEIDVRACKEAAHVVGRECREALPPECRDDHGDRLGRCVDAAREVVGDCHNGDTKDARQACRKQFHDLVKACMEDAQ